MAHLRAKIIVLYMQCLFTFVFMTEQIIPARWCWVESKLVFLFAMFMLLFYWGLPIVLSFRYGSFQYLAAYLSDNYLMLSVLLLLVLVVLLRVKKGYFYLERFEFTYPFRLWDKKVYQLPWKDLVRAKTNQPWRERRRMRMCFKGYNIAFNCSRAEVLRLRDTLDLTIDMGPKWNQFDN